MAPRPGQRRPATRGATATGTAYDESKAPVVRDIRLYARLRHGVRLNIIRAMLPARWTGEEAAAVVLLVLAVSLVVLLVAIGMVLDLKGPVGPDVPDGPPRNPAPPAPVTASAGRCVDEANAANALIRGTLDKQAYRRAMAELAAADAVRRPLVVPPDART